MSLFGFLCCSNKKEYHGQSRSITSDPESSRAFLSNSSHSTQMSNNRSLIRYNNIPNLDYTLYNKIWNHQIHGKILRNTLMKQYSILNTNITLIISLYCNDESRTLKIIRQYPYDLLSRNDIGLYRENDPNKVIKLPMCLLGSMKIGKTKLRDKLMDMETEWNELYYEQNGVDCRFINYDLGHTIMSMNENDNYIKIEIWDISGNERFRSITKRYWRKCKFFILCFSLTDYNSFIYIINIFHEMIHMLNTNELKSNDDNRLLLPCILLGLQCDLLDIKRKIPLNEITQFIDEFNIPYIEVSTKDNINIRTVLDNVVKERFLYSSINGITLNRSILSV